MTETPNQRIGISRRPLLGLSMCALFVVAEPLQAQDTFSNTTAHPLVDVIRQTWRSTTPVHCRLQWTTTTFQSAQYRAWMTQHLPLLAAPKTRDDSENLKYASTHDLLTSNGRWLRYRAIGPVANLTGTKGALVETDRTLIYDWERNTVHALDGPNEVREFPQGEISQRAVFELSTHDVLPAMYWTRRDETLLDGYQFKHEKDGMVVIWKRTLQSQPDHATHSVAAQTEIALDSAHQYRPVSIITVTERPSTTDSIDPWTPSAMTYRLTMEYNGQDIASWMAESITIHGDVAIRINANVTQIEYPSRVERDEFELGFPVGTWIVDSVADEQRVIDNEGIARRIPPEREFEILYEEAISPALSLPRHESKTDGG